MNFNYAFMDRFFRKVDGVVWDLMTGKIGFQNDGGICSIDLGEVVDGCATDAQISINPFEEFGLGVPGFAQSVSVDSISLGDMIYSSASGNIVGWVVKKNEKSFKLMKQDGTCSDWTPPKVQMLGFDSGVMVIRSLMNMLPGGSSQLGQMQSFLIPMMMFGDSGEFDVSKIMPMMLFSQMGMGGVDQSATPGMMNSFMILAAIKSMMGNKEIDNGIPKPTTIVSKKNKSYFDLADSMRMMS